ncbi:hypothetical protein DEU56DRAFT_370876 [Suillus clintonianus]|uniref:uncharacterized protein n=1 Tax=Suillus clintonianus TaxID=1904413 RepID=UPI001B864A05|nr:uncharacterized protein DEU56DRAFT_370876 [Suillus clintonianus]KAG2154599.1 hypothetical protein DEU56DRAFT_370876 [Suillus clintonianus]
MAMLRAVGQPQSYSYLFLPVVKPNIGCVGEQNAVSPFTLVSFWAPISFSLAFPPSQLDVLSVLQVSSALPCSIPTILPLYLPNLSFTIHPHLFIWLSCTCIHFSFTWDAPSITNDASGPARQCGIILLNLVPAIVIHLVQPPPLFLPVDGCIFRMPSCFSLNLPSNPRHSDHCRSFYHIVSFLSPSVLITAFQHLVFQASTPPHTFLYYTPDI